MPVTPLVGITTYVTRARWSYWDLEAALIPADYVDAVSRAGGRPVLLPPVTAGTDETLGALDAIVFTGGSDIDPGLYGAETHPETFGVHRQRDDAELALIQGALERDMPVLGICRGVQVLNVALGGDLHQHLPDVVGHNRHKHDPPGRFLEHDVAILRGTRLSAILGESATVMSHHHQGIRRLGAGLVAVAHADDGTLEAVEAPGHRFAVGVLWHPEAAADRSLFEGLVQEGRAFAATRSAA
jgi:putative glutamine amidotransferase